MTYLIADLFLEFSQMYLLFKKLSVAYISNTSHLNKTILKPHKMIDSTVSSCKNVLYCCHPSTARKQNPVNAEVTLNLAPAIRSVSSGLAMHDSRPTSWILAAPLLAVTPFCITHQLYIPETCHEASVWRSYEKSVWRSLKIVFFFKFYCLYWIIGGFPAESFHFIFTQWYMLTLHHISLQQVNATDYIITCNLL